MSTALTSEQTVALLEACLTVVKEELGVETNINKLLTLFGVASNPGVEQFALGDDIGVATSTLSRIIVDLSGVNRHREPGPNIVHAYADPMWRRRNLLELTNKGKALMEKINRAANKTLK